MAVKINITLEYLKEAVTYNPDTGIFIWNKRPLNHFKSQRDCNRWNSRHSGKIAGSTRINKRDKYKSHVLKINAECYKSSIVAWVLSYGVWPELDIDHINCDSLDNKLNNLRLANHSQQSANKKTFEGKIVKGVHKSSKNRWRSSIVVNGMRKHLGLFDCPAAASFAYQIASDIHFGEFARAF